MSPRLRQTGPDSFNNENLFLFHFPLYAHFMQQKKPALSFCFFRRFIAFLDRVRSGQPFPDIQKRSSVWGTNGPAAIAKAA